MTDDTLDRWEAEAKDLKQFDYTKRILALIELVRNKDEAMLITLGEMSGRGRDTSNHVLKSAIALTREWK